MAVEPPSMPHDTPARAPVRRLVLIPGGRGAHDGRAGARPVLVHVVATRSDAVKLAPVHAALAERGAFEQVVVNTGQRTDLALTTDVFSDLGLLPPDHVLETGAGLHGAQIAEALAAGEALLSDLQPAAILVAGAADSTVGVALAASKLGVPVVQVEAGLREGDRRVPEELNRILLDTLADTLFVPTAQAEENLRTPDAGAGSVHLVGSTAIDSLRRAERSAADRATWLRFGSERGRYILVTLQRPANVEDDERLARIVEGLADLARHTPVIFPMHPRTRERLDPMGDAHRRLAAGVVCGPPLGYLDFVSLQAGAGAVVTDSATVQQEASAIGVRCYSLRTSTESPITITQGTNTLVGDPRDLADVRASAGRPTPCAIPWWDGRAARRIADALAARYSLGHAALR